MPRVIIERLSPESSKKFRIIFLSPPWERKLTLLIGQQGAEDFTIHRDLQRKENYIRRHSSREDWSASGIKTAGFWSRWLLWNKPTLRESIKDIRERFSIHPILRG